MNTSNTIYTLPMINTLNTFQPCLPPPNSHAQYPEHRGLESRTSPLHVPHSIDRLPLRHSPRGLVVPRGPSSRQQVKAARFIGQPYTSVSQTPAGVRPERCPNPRATAWPSRLCRCGGAQTHARGCPSGTHSSSPSTSGWTKIVRWPQARRRIRRRLTLRG